MPRETHEAALVQITRVGPPLILRRDIARVAALLRMQKIKKPTDTRARVRTLDESQLVHVTGGSPPVKTGFLGTNLAARQ